MNCKQKKWYGTLPVVASLMVVVIAGILYYTPVDSVADEGGGDPDPHEEAVGLTVTGWPKVPEQTDKAAYFARCSGAFAVEFEIKNSEDETEKFTLTKVELVLTDIPDTEDKVIDCTPRFIVTPTERSIAMYTGVSLPTVPANEFTLFAPSGETSKWWSIDFDDDDDDREEEDIQEISFYVRVITNGITLKSSKRTLVFGDKNVEVVEYLVERKVNNPMDLLSEDTKQNKGQKWEPHMVVTHRGDSYDNPTALARNGNAVDFFPNAKELGDNPWNDVHETFLQEDENYWYSWTDYVEEIDHYTGERYKWLAATHSDGQGWTLGRSPWSALAAKERRFGTTTMNLNRPLPIDEIWWEDYTDVGHDDWGAESSFACKWLKAGLHPTGDSDKEVTYQRVSMIGTVSVNAYFWCYYRAIDVTGLTGITKSVYWNPNGAGENKDQGLMKLRMLEGWKRSGHVQNCTNEATGMNWNLGAIGTGAINVAAWTAAGAQAGPGGAFAAGAAAFVGAFVNWAQGVSLPQGSAPGHLLFRQSRISFDYGDGESKEEIEVNDAAYIDRKENYEYDKKSIAITPNDVTIKPLRYYQYITTGAVGCNQTNVKWDDSDYWQYVLLKFEDGEEDKFYKLRIEEP
jgi:hypothetical protein